MRPMTPGSDPQPVASPRKQAIRELFDGLAESRNIVYKPCGAGGGDIGIALATDSAQLNTFVERAAESGFRHLDFDIDMTGVKIRREHE